MTIKYVGRYRSKGEFNYTATLYTTEKAIKEKYQLMWGDRVRVIKKGNKYSKVVARGMPGWIKNSRLNGKSLLEFYFIDVGQGDGVLIRTPDNKHILIDGGWPRSKQPLGKNACDFLDWKFAKDYEMANIELEAIICSHNDQDHYGALWDLFNPKQANEMRISQKNTFVENVYHAGLSWWEKTSTNSVGKKVTNRTLGKVVTKQKDKFFVDLLSDRVSIVNGLKSKAKPKLQGEWAKFLRCISKSKTKGGKNTPFKRLGSNVGFLPGFENDNKSPSIKVLGPVDFKVGNKDGIRYFSGGTSKNTNGNSVLLRVDYGRKRFLLTGDLNLASQESLLTDYKCKHDEFRCDVAKACHHGSEDVAFDFLKAMNPVATIISSGDSEGHDHPRPNIIAAAGFAGRATVRNNKIESPLVYSTELARSVKFSEISSIEDKKTGKIYKGKTLPDLAIDFKGRKNGPKLKPNDRSIATNIIFGLINVRTDGETILCSALNEKEKKWNIKTFC